MFLLGNSDLSSPSRNALSPHHAPSYNSPAFHDVLGVEPNLCLYHRPHPSGSPTSNFDTKEQSHLVVLTSATNNIYTDILYVLNHHVTLYFQWEDWSSSLYSVFTCSVTLDKPYLVCLELSFPSLTNSNNSSSSGALSLTRCLVRHHPT